MSKRKSKKSRKRKEILKAQKKSQGRAASNLSAVNNSPKEETATKKKSEYELPIKIIKKDLLKTGIFLAAALILLFTLHFSGIGYSEFLDLIK